MFENLPTDYKIAQDWDWDQYQPYVQDLLDRDLTADSLHAWMLDYTRLCQLIEEVGARAEVAVTCDTTDKEFERRFNHYVENIEPEYKRANNAMQRKLLDSGLEPDNMSVPLRNVRAEVELFREENLPLQTEVTKLNNEYDKITGAQTVEWEGEEKTLSQLRPLMLKSDRSLREKVWRLSAERQRQDREAQNKLWNRLVHLRQQIAENAGCKDYREYQWRALYRFDYTPDDALAFFDAIEQTVVPVTERIAERRRERLGLDTLRPWDLAVDPLNREPLHPFENVDGLMDGIERIFNRVDSQLGGYIKTMRDENLLDLDNRKGKAGGGYCTAFPVAKHPFIFMNAVGLHDDVQTMLHEAGHAFHVFESADLPYMQQSHWTFVPMEFAEVASMAMELLAAPYLTTDQGGFYSEVEAARARIEHLESNIAFWPYMALVAAFQHWVYPNWEEAADPARCDEKYLELWNRYMKGIDISGLEDLILNRWRRQGHIFQVPFYYIEYGLAQLGAVQVWANSLKDPEAALKQYREALALGGTAKLPDLYKTAGARLAFDADTLSEAVGLMEKTITELEAV